MVKTGYISFLTQTDGYQNEETGNFVEGTATWSDFVECNLRVITKEYIRTVDGQVKQASYSVYVDNENVTVDMTTIKKISLKDGNGNGLNEFQVMNYEPLSLMPQIKIVV